MNLVHEPSTQYLVSVQASSTVKTIKCFYWIFFLMGFVESTEELVFRIEGFMQNAIEKVASVAAQLKEPISILFSLVATILAIFTYRRARFTIFQPLKSEVVKRQTDLLIDLYAMFRNQHLSAIGALDYINVVFANSYKQFIDLGLTTKDENNETLFMETISEEELWLDHVSVGFPVVFSNQHKEERRVNAQTESDQRITPHYLNSLLESDHCIDIIYMTSQHVETKKKIHSTISNPLTPKGVISILRKLVKEIDNNMKGVLPNVLEEVVRESCKRNLEQQLVRSIDYRAIVNGFLHNANNHEKTIDELQEAIRKLLRVDLRI